MSGGLRRDPVESAHARAPRTWELLLAAIALLLILAVILPNRIGGGLPRETVAQTWTEIIASASRIYFEKTGRVPELADLTEPFTPRGVRGLENLEPDPWGTDYLLVVLGEPPTFTVISAGPDLLFATPDDISSTR